MIRSLALSALLLGGAFAAHADETPQGRAFTATAIGLCLDFHEGDDVTTAPPPFAPNPQGYLVAEDRGVAVGVRAQLDVDPDSDPDFPDIYGTCDVRVEGSIPWIAEFAATQVRDLESLGWDIADNRSGVFDNMQTFTLLGFGTVTLRYGVNGENAQFLITWLE